MALVLGGAGHLGHALLRELMGRGYRVVALTRRPRPSLLEGLDVEVVRGDADDPGTLDRLAEGASVIVDAAAPYPLYLEPGSFRGAPVVEAAALRAASVVATALRSRAALVFISSFTTLPRSKEASAARDALAALEARARRVAHPYFAAKEAMERVVLLGARKGLRAVIVNPTACLGPWDDKPRTLAYLPLLLAGAIPATSSHLVNVVDVRDVARGAFLALEAGLFGAPLLMAGHDVRADALSARACSIAGVRPPRLRGSARAAATLAYWAERAFTLTGRRAPFPSLPALLLCEARAMGLGTEQRALGALPRPLDETLSDSIAWYRGRSDPG